MARKFYLVAVTILGLAFSSCTNDVNEDIMADASGTLSNTEAEMGIPILPQMDELKTIFKIVV